MSAAPPSSSAVLPDPGSVPADPVDGPADHPRTDDAAPGPANRDKREKRDFNLLWGGQSAGLVADQIFLLALPLAAIRELHASTMQVATLATAAKLPYLLVGLPAGVWVARLGLRRSMVWSDVVRGVTVVSVPLAALAGLLTLPHLLIAGLVIGVAAVFFQVAYQSYPPSLISDDDRLHGANTRLSLSESMARLLGPGLAGALIDAIGAARSLFVNSGSYLLSVLTLLAIRHRVPPEPPPAVRRGLWQEIGEGLRFVAGHPVLRPIMVCGALYNLGFAMYESLLALFAVRQLHLRPSVLGLAIALGGIGFPLGSLGARWLARRFGTGPAIIIAGVPSVVGLLVVTLADGRLTIPLIATGVLLNGLGQGSFAVNAITVRHVVTPERMATRATSVHRFVSWGALPVGSVVAGLVGTAFGLRTAMIVAAVTTFSCLIPLLFSPLRRVSTPQRPAAA